MAGLQCWNCWGKGGFRCRWGRVKGVGYDQKRKYLLLCLQALSLWALWHGICVRFKQEAKVSRELLSGTSVRVKRERTAAGLHPWWNHRVKFIHNEKPGGFKRYSLRKNENCDIIYSPAWRSKSVWLLQRVLQSLQLVPTGIEAFTLIDNAEENLKLVHMTQVCFFFKFKVYISVSNHLSACLQHRIHFISCHH